MDQPDEFLTAFTATTAEQSAEEQARAAQEAVERQRAAIETLVAQRLREAVQAKENSGIEQIWIDDEDQYNGYDEVNPPIVGSTGVKDQSEQSKKAGKRSTVFLNITKPKTDTAIARVTDMSVPHDDRPWEITNTPVPALEKAAAGQDPRQIMLKDGKQASAEQVATWKQRLSIIQTAIDAGNPG